MNIFVHDFLLRMVSREHIRLCVTDTDSLYFATSSANLEDIVLPQYRQLFHQQLYGHHDTPQDEIRPLTNVGFFPRQCCQKHRDLDMLTPGLFKSEVENATSICALSSKTYVVKGPNLIKVTSKGLQKSRLHNAWERYLAVLTGRRVDGVENMSFRVFLDKVYTFRQKRLGLSAIYQKAVVLSDGVTTKPLNIR